MQTAKEKSTQSMEARLAAALRDRGRRVTPQRLTLARLIEESGDHFTAENLHTRVRDRLPGVSLPTVYATLDLLEELGLIRRLLTQSGVVVYDPVMDDHHHLVCQQCGSIIDVEAAVDDAALISAAEAAGFKPAISQVVVRGFCAGCRG